jgi:uncharacterized protein YjlB
MANTISPTLYDIKPTALVPNSHKPVLHYKRFFTPDTASGKVSTTTVYDVMKQHDWDVQWVARYGYQQRSHYHPETHECMAVLSGPGLVRFGVADLVDDWKEHTYGTGFEDGSVLVEAEVGDVFVIPAGVSHKNYDPRAKDMESGFLTGGGHELDGDGGTEVVKDLQMPSTFVMIGSYPQGSGWTWAEGGDHVGRFEEVWNVKLPGQDPLFGDVGGIKDYWKA